MDADAMIYIDILPLVILSKMKHHLVAIVLSSKEMCRPSDVRNSIRTS